MKTKLPKSNFFTVLMLLLACGMFAATISSTSTGGDFSEATTWVGGVVPTTTDDVIITSGSTVIVTNNTVVNSISLVGTGVLTVIKDKRLTIYGSITVSSGAQFNAGTGNSDSAIILVYGDFTNNGTANFWKSTVVIAGDLTTASTILQNNGNIIVGGSVAGNISGSGTGSIYAINTNGTVAVTGGADVKPLGTLPNDSTLLALLNQVIYTNTSCTFPIGDPTNQTLCSSQTTGKFTATSTNSSTFQWQINTGSGWVNTGITNTGSTSELSVSSLTSGMNRYRYRASITYDGCQKNGDFAYLFVNPSPVLSSTLNPPAICSANSFTYIAKSATAGSTFSWSRAVISGISNTIESGTNGTISEVLNNTTTDPIVVTYVIITTANACSKSQNVTITVNPLPTAPTINSTTQPTCTVSTGSITLGGLPSGGWKLYRSGTSSATDGSGTTTTINGLAVGDYTFTVDNLSCISSSSLTATISNAYVPVNRWSGKVWSSGTPTLDQQIVFDDSYEEFVDVIEGCSCIVEAGKTVTIRSRKTLRIVNQVEVRGDGILTFEDKASLVQIKDVPADPNLGKITYRRSTLPILKTDYVYWSTPVTTAALGDIQSGTLYYSFNALGNKWVNASAGTAMDTGKGYIVRGAGTWFDTGSITLTPNFKGVPNNGIVKAYLTPGKNNLIGNPYPSAIDGDAFINANTNTTALSNSLSGTLYFWTHKSTIQLASNITNGTAGSGKFAYTSDDYDTYTLTGGTGGLNTGTIAAGQGFFAPASSTGGNAIFNNSMRLSSSGGVLDNAQFLKQVVGSKAIKTTSNSKLDKNRVWLNLTNSGGAFKQILIGYITGATNGYESTYDGNNFNANSFVNFYSINQNRNLTIEGRALPFDQDDVVPLGYKSTIVEEFKIAIDKTDGFLSNKKINLEDKLLGKIQDLSEAPYVFTTEVGTFNERFVLSYANKTAASTIMLGTGDYKKASEAVLISNKNKEIKISSSTNEIDKVFVYDLSGRQIYTASKVEKNELIIKTIMSSNQVLIIKVVLQNQSTVTKKIIY